MATCHMRLGDAQAARAALEADPKLQAHADVAAKLAEIKTHGTRISAVGYFGPRRPLSSDSGSTI